MRLTCPCGIALFAVCAVVGCGDSESERILRFCESRNNADAIPATGEGHVAGIGSPLGISDSYEPFVIRASESELELELCDRPFDGDWHVMTVWHLEGPAPQTLGTYPPGSYFEGYSRGRFGQAPIVHNAFFTAADEAIALPGEGAVEIYDPTTGRFKATMTVNGGSDDLGGAVIDLDITWTPR